MSWQWAVHLAMVGVKVTALINRQDPTAPIDPRTAPLPAEIRPGLEPEFIDVAPPRSWRRLPVVLYTALDYQGWQRRARQQAEELHRAAPFDVIHQLSWASIHHGTQLGASDAPLVLGPIGGGTTSAAGYRDCFPTTWRFEQLRNAVVRTIGLNPRARRLVRRSNLILASNSETVSALRRLGAGDVHIMLDDGVDPVEVRSLPVEQPRSGPLRVLWVGRILERKGLGMALRAVRMASTSIDIQLTVMGDGEHRHLVATELTEMSQAGLVVDRGWSDRPALEQAFASHDVLLFSSVRDNGGAPLHAATAYGMPAIVIDHQGPGAITSPEWAIRVPAATTERSERAIAEALIDLARDPDRRAEMGFAALAAGRRNTWPQRAQAMAGFYEEAIRTATGGTSATSAADRRAWRSSSGSPQTTSSRSTTAGAGTAPA